MVRFVFCTMLLLPFAALLLALAAAGLGTWPQTVSLALMIVLSLGWTALYLLGYRTWIDRHRPTADVTRLKAYLEMNGVRVVAAKPAGVEVNGRTGPDWRKYFARIRLANGEEADRIVGVQVTLLARSAVKDYDHPHRTDYLIS